MLSVEALASAMPLYLGLSGSDTAKLAERTERPIIIYNFPYRTGVNLANDTLLKLAERDNIATAKDCCANSAQSFELTSTKPDRFSVLTGEDTFFHNALDQGRMAIS